jgi:ABC-type nitrate/sulfonate/bicarbonate transport system substrate-binding protein
MRNQVLVSVLLSALFISSCDKQNQPNNPSSPLPTTSDSTATALSSAISYTPYDALGMIWSQSAKEYRVNWTTSGGEAGKLLVSKGDVNQRPSWIFSSQGVASGLVAKGEKVVIIATIYTDSNTVLPVFRKPKKLLSGNRSLFIPRSSIEFAFDNLLKREGVKPSEINVPKVENVSFPTIASLLLKPAEDKDALDFGLLVEPFITNVVEKNPDKYEIGQGGLYELHYSVVVRTEDLKANRAKYVELLRQLLAADKKLAAFPDDDTFYKETWGREKDGKPELLPKTLTFKRSAAKLQLQPTRLRQLLKEELTYLTQKYPDQLKMPENVDALVDPSLLQEVASERVKN